MKTFREYAKSDITFTAIVSMAIGAFFGEIGHWGVATMFFLITFATIIYCNPIVIMDWKTYTTKKRDGE